MPYQISSLGQVTHGVEVGRTLEEGESPLLAGQHGEGTLDVLQCMSADRISGSVGAMSKQYTHSTIQYRRL